MSMRMDEKNMEYDEVHDRKTIRLIVNLGAHVTGQDNLNAEKRIILRKLKYKQYTRLLC